MKTALIASLVAAQLLAAQPATAASFEQLGPANTEAGVFAGARLRIPLGSASRNKARIGLTLAPMTRSRWDEGRTRLRFGEGVGLGITGNGPIQVSLAGRPLSAFAPGAAAEIDTRDKRGISTLGAVGIGAGVLLVAGIVYVVVLTSQCYECDD